MPNVRMVVSSNLQNDTGPNTSEWLEYDMSGDVIDMDEYHQWSCQYPSPLGEHNIQDVLFWTGMISIK